MEKDHITHSSRASKLILFLPLVIVVVVTVPLLQETNPGWTRGDGALEEGGAGTAHPATVGTSGSSSASDTRDQSLIDAARIDDGEDARHLIGHQVTVRVPARDTYSDLGFLVPVEGATLVAVAHRDTRDERARREGLPPEHAIEPLAPEQQEMTISGTIVAPPSAEDVHNWQLTASERRVLATRHAYLRIDRISNVDPSQVE